MDESNALHMLRLRLDGKRLVELGRKLRLPMRNVDNGYLVHCMLGELFGDHSPSPFVIDGQHDRHTEVLAYSSVDGETLRASAGLTDPAWHAAVDWDSYAAKPMPTTFPAGMRLRFELQACPVVRMASADTSPERKWKKGSEVDAFLAACWKVDKSTKVDRGDVYRTWLGKQLERRGGARLVEGEPPKLVNFQLTRMVRRTHGKGRRSRVMKRPSARLRGLIEVDDSNDFIALLRRGIGRHRSFGFGMLCVRRA